MLKKINDLKPIETYKAYVEDAINEKLLTSSDISRDPDATIINNENNPKA